MRVLVDTNILTRSAHTDSASHQQAVQSVNRLAEEEHRLFLVPQVLYEFWVVATRPKGENGLGMSVSSAAAELTELERLFTVLRDERAILTEWERLVREYEVKGRNGHDARLVAAMLRHGIDAILTFNVAHFARFEREVRVLSPAQVLEGRT